MAPEAPLMTLFLDPAKGNAITRWEARLPNGVLELEFDLEISDVTKHGDWYPTHCTEHFYSQTGDKSQGEMRWSSEWTLGNVRLHPKFMKEDFTVEWLKVPEGGKLVCFSADGKRTELVRSNGQFVFKDSSAP
jgi:hypothetical protein